MAKQRGIFRASGKIEGRSFYYSRLGGALSRSIDPTLGERVRTAPEYAVLRAKSKEFGQAGKMAGVILSCQSNYWRYIYRTMAAGDLAKFVQSLLEHDNTHPVGLRVVIPEDFNTLRDLVNGLSKNQPPASVLEIADKMEVMRTARTLVLSEPVKLGQALADYLNNLHANHFNLSIWCVGYAVSRVEDGEYASDVPRAAHPVRLHLEQHSSNRWEANDTLCASFTQSLVQGRVTLSLEDDTTGMAGALIVLEPCYKHGGQTDILQRGCSAYWDQVPTFYE